MDIKQALVTVINNNCTCGFLASQINQGEFSCRNMVDGHVTYRLMCKASVSYAAHLPHTVECHTLPYCKYLCCFESREVIIPYPYSLIACKFACVHVSDIFPGLS